MIYEVIEGIVKFLFYVIFRVFFESIFFYTGECLLYLITFGKRAPRWNYYIDKKPAKFVILTELSIWIGVLGWILVIFTFIKYVV